MQKEFVLFQIQSCKPVMLGRTWHLEGHSLWWCQLVTCLVLSLTNQIAVSGTREAYYVKNGVKQPSSARFSGLNGSTVSNTVLPGDSSVFKHLTHGEHCRFKL